jgi:hypothetical protein
MSTLVKPPTAGTGRVVTSYGGQCRDAGSVRHIRLFRRRRPNRHHTRVSDEAGSRRSGRVAQPALHCDRNCRRPSTPCAINRRPTASLRALAEVKKARCLAGPSKQGDRAYSQRLFISSGDSTFFSACSARILYFCTNPLNLVAAPISDALSINMRRRSARVRQCSELSILCSL